MTIIAKQDMPWIGRKDEVIWRENGLYVSSFSTQGTGVGSKRSRTQVRENMHKHKQASFADERRIRKASRASATLSRRVRSTRCVTPCSSAHMINGQEDPPCTSPAYHDISVLCIDESCSCPSTRFVPMLRFGETTSLSKPAAVFLALGYPDRLSGVRCQCG